MDLKKPFNTSLNGSESEWDSRVSGIPYTYLESLQTVEWDCQNAAATIMDAASRDEAHVILVPDFIPGNASLDRARRYVRTLRDDQDRRECIRRWIPAYGQSCDWITHTFRRLQERVCEEPTDTPLSFDTLASFLSTPGEVPFTYWRLAAICHSCNELARDQFRTLVDALDRLVIDQKKRDEGTEVHGKGFDECLLDAIEEAFTSDWVSVDSHRPPYKDDPKDPDPSGLNCVACGAKPLYGPSMRGSYEIKVCYVLRDDKACRRALRDTAEEFFWSLQDLLKPGERLRGGPVIYWKQTLGRLCLSILTLKLIDEGIRRGLAPPVLRPKVLPSIHTLRQRRPKI